MSYTQKQLDGNVLVTGAGGFIGANLVLRLIKTNPVHIIVREKTSLWRLKPILNQLIIHKINLLNKVKLQRVIKRIKPKIIYHLASYGNYSFHENIEAILTTNMIGTYRLLEACAHIGFDSFINTGTSSEYGLKKKAMSEIDLLEPVSFYAVSKSAATLLSQVYAKFYGLPIVTLRPFSVYGPYEDKSRLIPTVIRNITENRSIRLTSSSVRRDFVYIEDVVGAFLKFTKHINNVKGEVINIGTGKQFSNEDVVNTAIKILGKRVDIKFGGYPNRNWDTSYWVADIAKARKFGWVPEYNLLEGMRKTILWFKSHKTLYDE